MDRHDEPPPSRRPARDLALVRTRAEPQPDGSYKIFGTKIFITYGEHDMAENIVHLVLARVAGAPEGVKGISLFVVPKFLVNADGSAGRAQRRALRQHRAQAGHQGQPDRRCCSLATRAARSATLVGQENRGLEYMFIMMNAARYASACRASRWPSAPTRRPWPTRRTACSPPGGRLDAGQRAHHPPPDVRAC